MEGPSFVLLSLIPSAINVFTYTLKDGKLDVKKNTFPKNESCVCYKDPINIAVTSVGS